MLACAQVLPWATLEFGLGSGLGVGLGLGLGLRLACAQVLPWAARIGTASHDAGAPAETRCSTIQAVRRSSGEINTTSSEGGGSVANGQLRRHGARGSCASGRPAWARAWWVRSGLRGRAWWVRLAAARLCCPCGPRVVQSGAHEPM